MTLDARARDLLQAAFRAALRAADPRHVLAPALPPRPKGRTVVVGAGKAAAVMAAALEDAWDGELRGLVITRYGHGRLAQPQRIEVVEAAHPVPDQAGVDATLRLMRLLDGLRAEDLVITLLSGGGSALLCQPLAGVGIGDKQALTQALLRSGATITEMNTVRQRLSQVKGGRLAARAAPARVVTLYISDIPGDALASVASGPTVPVPTGGEAAEAILTRYGIEPPRAIREALAREDSQPPGADRLPPIEAHMIASARQSLDAARAYLLDRGINAVILSDRMEGEARVVGAVHAALAHECAATGAPFTPPVVLLSGGETTVTVSGTGRGGRNSEFALGCALHLGDAGPITGLAADTDGIDGVEDNAGAVFDTATVARLRAAGIDPQRMLGNNDAYSAFAALGQLLRTGPTGTNVNDFRALLIGTLPEG